jgi:hypothetical protein
MSTVAEKLLTELDKLAKEAKDEETKKEIIDLEIRLQRGSLKGKAKAEPLTLEEREEAVLKYMKERGLDAAWAEESIKKRRQQSK